MPAKPLANLVDIRVPELGESITSATVAKWLKSPGEAVGADEPVVELETDKVAVEVPSPVEGMLAANLQPQGSEVEIGTVLGNIDTAAVGTVAKSITEQPEPQPAAKESEKASEKATSKVADKSAAVKPAAVKPAAVKSAAVKSAAVKSAPSARLAASERGVDLARLQGSGLGGAVTRSDVDASQPSSQPSSSFRLSRPAARDADERGEEVVPMSRLRQRVAERLKEAQNTAALLTTFNEVNMASIVALRKRHREAFERRHRVKLGFMSFFVRASVLALNDYPEVNAQLNGTDIVYRRYCDLGIAVSAPQGLVVPVLRNAQTLSFAAIEEQIAEFATRAREGKLTLSELSGGTFTITNGGVFGSLLSTPIVNPPQSAILGMHTIQERPVAFEGEVRVAPMMYVALTYDHRLIDGRGAVSFLTRVKALVEHPESLLLDI